MKNLSEADIQKLEDYWSGLLDAEEAHLLEQRLESDSAFREAAAEWRLVLEEALVPPLEEKEEQDEIKARLLGYASDEKKTSHFVEHKELKRRKPAVLRRIYTGLAVAAAIALLLWLTPLNQLFQPQNRSDAFFTHLSRDNANLSSDISIGEQAYDQKKYKKAFPALMDDVRSQGDSLNLIYASVAAIGSGQGEQAIQILDPLAVLEGWKLYRAEIHWYLALAYLDQGQLAKTEQLLDDIILEDNGYVEAAKNLKIELAPD
ncbi:MAG: hypothetical protein KTR30_18785 [Saprospiraceae bacterium]|nr:hypothetical protein [Saprospiraceae bacterium]